MVNAEGTEVTDAVDLGVGIFKDSKYASLVRICISRIYSKH